MVATGIHTSAVLWDGDEFVGGRWGDDEATRLLPFESLEFSLGPSSSSSSSSPASCIKSEIPEQRKILKTTMV
jgi:hypothetical protein